MPKDNTTIPPFGGLTRAEAEKLKKLGGGLAPAVGEELKKHGAALSPETREAFRPSLALDPRILSAQRASELLTTLRRDLADRKAALRQELEAREAATRREIEVLRRELEAREAEASQENEARRVAAGREIAGLEEQLREAEAWAEPFGVPRPRPAPTAAAPTPEPEPIDPPEPDEEEQDGPQTELTRLFFQEVYGGPPPKKLGYRPLHARMKVWVADKNKGDGGNRIAASETTIRNVRNERAT